MRIRVCANEMRDKGGILWCSWKAGKNIVGEVGQIRHAASDKIWSWLANEVFDTTGNEPSTGTAQSQTQPSSMPLPQLSLPNQTLWHRLWNGWSWHEDHANEEDDDCWCKHTDEDEHQRSDRVFAMWETDLWVREREWALYRWNCCEVCSDTSKHTV